MISPVSYIRLHVSVAVSPGAAFLTAIYKTVLQVNYQHCGLQETFNKNKCKYYALCP